MIDFDEASAILRAAAIPLEPVSVPLADAHGLVLAADLLAAIDSPRRDVSAMDGYAVRDADLAALPARLRIAGEAFAGQSGLAALAPGTTARIFTGGAAPAGADRVVVQEIVEHDGEWAVFAEAPGKGRHIRLRASDFAEGATLLPAGTLLGPRALVAAAAADLADVTAWRRPRFTILSTGDELAPTGTARENPASIPDSISFGVAALGRAWGGAFAGQRRLRDDPALLEAAAAEALAGAELVVVTGGASVGERDFAKSMFAAFAPELLFSKVAIKPGKPVWLARAQGRLILGLPGNPTSAMVTARLFLGPLIAGLAGRDPTTALRWRKATLAAPLPACGDRETFARGRWAGEAVEPLSNQDSGAQKALAEADILIRRLAGAPPAEAGDLVDVLPF
jgi:molybdopterin molybdotransferase